jgi:hypothetical protein
MAAPAIEKRRPNVELKKTPVAARDHSSDQMVMARIITHVRTKNGAPGGRSSVIFTTRLVPRVRRCASDNRRRIQNVK